MASKTETSKRSDPGKDPRTSSDSRTEASKKGDPKTEPRASPAPDKKSENVDFLPKNVEQVLKQFLYHFVKDNITDDPAAFVAYASDYFYNKRNPAAAPKTPKDNLAPKKMPVTQQPCSPGAPCYNKSRNPVSPQNQTPPQVYRVPSERPAPVRGAPLNRQIPQSRDVSQQRLPVAPSKSQMSQRGPSPSPSSRLSPAQSRMLAPSNQNLLSPNSHHSVHKTKSSPSQASSYNSFQKVMPYVDKQGRPKQFVCCNCGKGKYQCHCSSIDDFSSLDVTKSEWWLSQKSAMDLLEQRKAQEDTAGPRSESIPRNETEFNKAEEARRESSKAAVNDGARKESSKAAVDEAARKGSSKAAVDEAGRKESSKAAIDEAARKGSSRAENNEGQKGGSVSSQKVPTEDSRKSSSKAENNEGQRGGSLMSQKGPAVTPSTPVVHSITVPDMPAIPTSVPEDQPEDQPEQKA